MPLCYKHEKKIKLQLYDAKVTSMSRIDSPGAYIVGYFTPYFFRAAPTLNPAQVHTKAEKMATEMANPCPWFRVSEISPIFVNYSGFLDLSTSIR
mmetsp:Transcript_4586/g.5294  ORF Transcript_4586/g.5294 Transcript_4586/m.5294 type:complete len:95 (-) Transcript_4586:290-574(-)